MCVGASDPSSKEPVRGRGERKGPLTCWEGEPGRMAEDFSQGLRIWARGAAWPLGPGRRNRDSEGTYGSNSCRNQPGESGKRPEDLRDWPVIDFSSEGRRVPGVGVGGKVLQESANHRVHCSQTGLSKLKTPK